MKVHHLHDVVPVDREQAVLALAESVHHEDRDVPGLTDRTPRPQECRHHSSGIHAEVPVSRLLLLVVYVRLPGDVVDSLLLHGEPDHLGVVGGPVVVQCGERRLLSVEGHQVTPPTVLLSE